MQGAWTRLDQRIRIAGNWKEEGVRSEHAMAVVAAEFGHQLDARRDVEFD